MTPLGAGTLRTRVEVQNRTTARDAYGDALETWGTAATVWAEVVPLSGRELWAAQQAQADATVRVRVRYRADVTVTPRTRLLVGSRILNVSSVINVGGRNRLLELLCVEEV